LGALEKLTRAGKNTAKSFAYARKTAMFIAHVD
jgi:hypothetical protein